MGMRGLLSLLMAIGVACAGCTVGHANGTAFLISPDGEQNRIVVSAVQDGVAMSVLSRSGIGRASMVLVSGSFPENLVFYLYTDGLEELQLSYDQVTILLMVSSSGDREIRQYVTDSATSAERTNIDSSSPLWLVVDRMPECDVGTAPTTNCFRVVAPPDMLRAQPERFELLWVDFYR